MKISILTATYNRASFLNKLYESIKNNVRFADYLECEWIIVDDGSNDKTKSLVEEFKKENMVNIKYMYQENSGKMVAINKAVEMAEGDLIIDCDSDDYLSASAFNIIEKHIGKLLKNPKIYALAFLKKDESEKISGKKFIKENKPTTMFNLYFQDDIKGEKILVYNAKIRKKYKHELEKGECFITEARMYHKMDNDYKIICINEVIEIGNYNNGGYTQNINKYFKNSPNGYYCYFSEILQKDMANVKMKKRFYAIKHYILFGYLAKKGFNMKNIRNINNKILYLILYIPGIMKSRCF